ncbi:MAG: ATP-dependent DNA helicase [bacterium]
MITTMPTYKKKTELKIIPTVEQQNAIKKIEDFFNDDSDILILNGPAGTGKTTLINFAINRLKETNRKYMLLAPTGRATKVLKDVTQDTASTIHKVIYKLEKITELKRMSAVQPLFKYTLQFNKFDKNTIYFIDEASMISNKKCKEDHHIFGANNLLLDIIKYTKVNRNDYNTKIIFIGDKYQLPPVGQSISAALNKGYWLKKYPYLKIIDVNLTNVKRQNLESGVFSVANSLKKRIQHNNFTDFEINQKEADIQFVSCSDFIYSYKNNLDSILITYSNRMADKYNAQIRKSFGYRKNTVCIGDKIIITKNNYFHDINLYNGEVGQILGINSNVKKFQIPIDKTKTIALSFRDVRIKFGDNQYVDCKILENNLYSDNNDISTDEERALYVLFKNKNNNISPINENFKNLLQNDPYFNAVRIKFAYAITCHKAQGGEWNNVYVDFEANNLIPPKVYFKWLYTAITRSKGNLFCINYESLRNLLNIKTHFIYDFLKNRNLSVVNIDQLVYRDRISITNNDEVVFFDFIYDRNWVVKEIKPSCRNYCSLENMLSVQLKTLIGCRKKNNPKYFMESNKHHRSNLFDFINEKLSGTPFIINKIIHNEFSETYVFSKYHEINVIEFKFDKSFEKVKYEYKKGNDNELKSLLINH